MKVETGPIIFRLAGIALICYLIYNDIPSKYTKLEESFDGFMNKSLVRFEFENSPLHTIVYGANNTGKTYFVKPYFNLYRKDKVEHKKRIVIVCKDDKKWINPETGMPNDGFNLWSLDMITSENINDFDNYLIVVDDMGNKLKKDIDKYFAGGKRCEIQVLVMGRKPAQIDHTARMSCDTI